MKKRVRTNLANRLIAIFFAGLILVSENPFGVFYKTLAAGNDETVTFTVTVTDEGNNPLEGAKVSIADEPEIYSFTDATGAATFQDVLADQNDYDCIIALKGYKTMTARFTVSNNGNYDADPMVAVDEVVVDGVRVGGDGETLKVGQAMELKVMAENARDYQWYKDSKPISGGTSNPYTIDDVKIEDAGSYYCKVTGYDETEKNSETIEISVTKYKAELSLSLTQTPSPNHPYDVVLDATLELEDGRGDVSGRTITFTIDDGQDVKKQTAVTDENGIAAYTLSAPPAKTYSFGATFDGDAKYKAASAEPIQGYKIDKGKQTDKSEFSDHTPIAKTYGDPDFSLPSVSGGNGKGEYLYYGYDPDVITVDSNGKVTIVGAGDTTVYVKKGCDSNWNEADVETDPELEDGVDIRIEPKRIQITEIMAENREYDGTDVVSISGGKLQGLAYDDKREDVLTEGDVPANGTMADADCGEGKAVRIPEIVPTGLKSGNYTLEQPSEITVDIGQKVLTVDVTVNDKKYDGKNTATIKSSRLIGVVEKDMDKIQLIDGTPQFENVGSAGDDTKEIGIEFIEAFRIEGDEIDTKNYTLKEEKPTGVKAEILAGFKPQCGEGGHYTVSNVDGTVIENDGVFGWYVNNDFIITPSEGYAISEGGDDDSDWSSPLTYSSDTTDGEVTFHIRRTGVDIGDVKQWEISSPVTVRYRIDKTKPEITGFTFRKPSTSTSEKVIHFLTFGIFFNETIEVNVSAKDTGDSSGLSHITIYNGTDEEVETKAVSGSSDNETFLLTLDDYRDHVISATVTDVASNVSMVTKPTDVEDNVKNDRVMLEDQAPTVQIIPDAETHSNGPEKWYEKDVGFKITVADNQSGIRSIEVTLNNQPLTEDKNRELINQTYFEREEAAHKMEFNINTDQNPVDGENIVQVKVVDNAGNETTASSNVFIDKTNPGIEYFEIRKADKELLGKVLNFLTFGIFYNEKAFVTVTANDGSGASSGLKSIILYADGTPVEGSPKAVDGNGKATFEIPFGSVAKNAKSFDQELSAVAVDNVGNVTGKDEKNPDGKPVFPTTVNSDIKDNGFMIETIDPTIDIQYETAVYTDHGGKEWYPSDVAFHITAKDADSGIRSVDVQMNGQSIYTDKNNKPINERFYEGVGEEGKKKAVYEASFMVGTDQAARADDGSYTIVVTVVDNAGNQLEDSRKVYKDMNAPYITNFEFNAKGTKEGDGKEASVKVTEYGFYFLEDTTVTISAKDNTPTSGIQSISYYMVDVNSGKGSEKIVSAKNDKISFVVPANFKGQIYAKARDNAGHEPKSFVNPNGAIVESKKKHLQETHITFKKDKTTETDRNGLELYAKDTDVKVTVTDTYSGLRKVEWSVEAPYDTGNNQSGSFEITNDKTYVEGGDASGWKKTKTDQNLVTEMTKTIRVKNNSNDIKVWVKITDRAGNVSKDEITFSIDKTVPTISVNYDNNEPDEQFADCFNSDRIATITITERNFKKDDVDIRITNTDGVIPEVSSWSTTNSNHPDRTTHTATVSYSADGDYTFDIAYKDNANNKAGLFEQQQFTVDKTEPVISVTYDNESNKNGNYYKANRTATISITEHNFEASRVRIQGMATDDGKEAEFPEVGDWTSDGDVHTASIHYSNDAQYTFDIEYTDRAGNDAAKYSPEEFFVDQTAPSLLISGVADRSANKGKVIPVISYSDTNLDRNNVSISLSGANKGEITPVGSYSEQHNGQVFTFENFEKVKENDDIYTLSVKLGDMAGNQTEQSIVFSVNRFGSVYVFDDTLKEIGGKYIQNEVDVVLTETNVDNLNHDSIKVKMTMNGTPKDLTEGTDYTIDEMGGGGEWSQYRYTIQKPLFSGDGRYTVALYSEDKAGNINENIDEKKKAEISFGVDKTQPVIVALDIESGKQYAVEEKTANLSIKDNLVLDGVNMYLNGEEVIPTVNGENYSFDISSLNSKQTVQIVALDAAGNINTLNVEDILITTNLFYRWLNHKPLFAGTLVGMGIVIGLAVFFAIFHKKKVVET